MALQILDKKGILYLSGRLNTITTRFFKMHLEHSLSCSDQVIINIDNLHEIDTDGVNAISAIMERFSAKRKLFRVMGKGCKEIYDHINSN